MSNSYFEFKKFIIRQERAPFKVGTDGVLLGACSGLSGAASILDVGTGTGLIAIMCAQRSEALITAIEPDNQSYLQAIGNAKDCPWSERIRIIRSDIRSFALKGGSKFDLIISNPPYFRDSLRNPDGIKSLTRHTISLSPEEMLNASESLLKDDGSLQVILPYEEGTMFIAEAAIRGFFCNSLIKVKPAPDGKIIRLIMKFEKVKKPVHEKFLTIETGIRHRYTEEYKELTKDFYLKF